MNRLLWRMFDNLVVLFLAQMEIMICGVLFAVFHPVPFQKIERVIQRYTCEYKVQTYDFSFETYDGFRTAEVKSFVDDLNYKLGRQVFVLNTSSKNKIAFKPKLENHSLFNWFFKTQTIGLTYCTNACCGTDNFWIEFDETEFYDFVKAKVIVWHELGHVVGLNHDDSQPDIMNSIALPSSQYNLDIQERYLNKVREKVGIK